MIDSLMRRLPWNLAAAGLLLTLSACGGGGGGGGDDGPASATSLQGVYDVQESAVSQGLAFVLEDGVLWALLIDESGETPRVELLQGGLTLDGSAVAGLPSEADQGLRYFAPAPAGPTRVSAFTGLRAGGGFNGTLSINALREDALSFVPVPNSVFPYRTAATATAMATRWDAVLTTGESLLFTVAVDGSFEVESPSGCAISGSLVPRANGRNVYNATFNFGPVPCQTPGLVARGIAVIQTEDGQRLLLGGMTSADRDFAVVLSGFEFPVPPAPPASAAAAR